MHRSFALGRLRLPNRLWQELCRLLCCGEYETLHRRGYELRRNDDKVPVVPGTHRKKGQSARLTGCACIESDPLLLGEEVS